MTQLSSQGRVRGDHRIASLDLLRGAAALAVAIPHFMMLGSKDWPVNAVISILAVEVFFVLSGYVLAPQLLQCLASPRASDTGIFLIRRWMRTVPPYLVALIIMTLISGGYYSGDLHLYALYIQNLFWQLPEARDYFAVAWSLSVEEWFYILFAFVVLMARALRFTRRQMVWTAIGFIVVFTILRIVFGNMGAWDAEVRRVVIFRVDSIAYGFLLYCLQDRAMALTASNAGKSAAWLTASLCAIAAFASGWFATTSNNVIAQHLYPFAAAAFGASLIFLLYLHRNFFQSRHTLAQISFFAGKISYTIYLFHIIAILLLRPQLQALPLFAQVSVYIIALILFCWFFFAFFEAPILAARPRYPRDNGVDQAKANWISGFWHPLRAPYLSWRQNDSYILAAIFAALATSIAATAALHTTRWSVLFYLALIASACSIVALCIQIRLWRFAIVRTFGLAAVFVALALPGADWLFNQTLAMRTLKSVKPVYSYREASGDPAAFSAWWTRYTDEWRNGAKSVTQMRDPKGILPFIQKPGVTAKFFDADVRINNAGFRGPDIPEVKGKRYRIFVVGESPVFGTMIKTGDKSWPAVLQELVSSRLRCDNGVEVVNAGVPGYTLSNNLESIRRFVLPLSPDMIISYHGFNGLAHIDPVLAQLPAPPVYKKRASQILAMFRFNMRLTRFVTKRNAFAKLESKIGFSDVFDRLYDELALLAHKHRIKLFIANLSTAVTSQSPKEVKDFYGRVFQPIDRILLAIEAHNRSAETAARRNQVPFIDTRERLAGEWDRDLFIDVVHFTQSGSNILAKKVFDALRPTLTQSKTLNCRKKDAEKE